MSLYKSSRMNELDNTAIKSIIVDATKQSLSAQAYNALLERFAKEGKTTGPEQKEDLIHYTKLNAQRGKRIRKTWLLNESLVNKIKAVDKSQHWLLITESWCGDAANSVPIIAQLADLNDNIDLKLVLRDDNLELMDQFLTNGGRSIPKLIVTNEAYEVLYTWGPRPAEAQSIHSNWRNSENRIPYSEFHVVLQKWYNEDAGKAMQEELLRLMIDG